MALNNEYFLYNSLNKKNKYTIKYINETTGRINTLNFGAKGYDDYLTSNDDEKNKLYKIQPFFCNINNLSYSGCWSTNLLWNKKSLDESIKDMEKHFKIKIFNHSKSY